MPAAAVICFVILIRVICCWKFLTNYFIGKIILKGIKDLYYGQCLYINQD